jgi:hypothetical protein
VGCLALIAIIGFLIFLAWRSNHLYSSNSTEAPIQLEQGPTVNNLAIDEVPLLRLHPPSSQFTSKFKVGSPLTRPYLEVNHHLFFMHHCPNAIPNLTKV